MQRDGVPVWTFDVISGLAGTGSYLLGRAEGFDNRVASAEPQAGFVGDAGYRLPASPDEDVDEKEAQ